MTTIITTVKALLERGIIKKETTFIVSEPKVPNDQQGPAKNNQNYAFLEGPESIQKLKNLFPTA